MNAVIEALDRLGVTYEVIECDPDFADTAAFCARYGYAPEISANTILVASRTEPATYAACIVTADRRLDVNGTVRRLMGVRKASFASADATQQLTGMAIGGVTPFALPDGLPIYIDSEVMDHDEVIVGGGGRSSKIKISPDALAALPNAQLVDRLSLAR